MNTIERVKEVFEEWREFRQIPFDQFEGVLDSLAAERCVWDIEVDVGCRTACDNYCCYCPDTDWIYCPYCGKRIEVKED